MNFLLSTALFFVYIYSACGEAGDGKSTPKVGHWNVTDHGNNLCIKMDAAIRLDIVYTVHNGTKKTTTIVSEGDEEINKTGSSCVNSSQDMHETMALRFSKKRLLTLHFTRDHNITGDQKQEKWQMYKISFHFKYDQDFPDAEKSGQEDTLSNENPLKVISSVRGGSFGCTKTDPLKITDQFTVTLDNLRVQPFMTGDNFGQAEWCSKEQTSDLIPIIIGAALAALVIIVLIAYLVGRARARTTTYDNI